jgi:hypothetical protein
MAESATPRRQRSFHFPVTGSRLRTCRIAGASLGRSRHESFADIVTTAHSGMPTQRSIRRIASTLMPGPVKCVTRNATAEEINQFALAEREFLDRRRT